MGRTPPLDLQEGSSATAGLDEKMGARERTQFELTLKGSEELAQRTYRLDAKVRNILFLIQKGYPTIDGILENSIFPREEVVERLRELLRGHFVTVLGRDASSVTPTTISRPHDSKSAGPATESSTPPPPDSPPTQPPIVFVGF